MILDQLGEEHMKTGKPIFYTSADSVFQIACHEETFGPDRLYELCEIAREELTEGGYNIGRVIARPFIGDKPGHFQRTGNRHDLAVEPPAPTVLKKLVDEKGGEVVSIGKIADIYANVGITKKVKATGIDALFDATLIEMEKAGDNTIVFTNFVDFDSSYGHRRDVGLRRRAGAVRPPPAGAAEAGERRRHHHLHRRPRLRPDCRALTTPASTSRCWFTARK